MKASIVRIIANISSRVAAFLLAFALLPFLRLLLGASGMAESGGCAEVKSAAGKSYSLMKVLTPFQALLPAMRKLPCLAGGAECRADGCRMDIAHALPPRVTEAVECAKDVPGSRAELEKTEAASISAHNGRQRFLESSART